MLNINKNVSDIKGHTKFKIIKQYIRVTTVDAQKEKRDYFSHVIQASTVFLTASRAYGMYDNEYHVIASDWIIINRRARPGLCKCKAANNVKPIETNTNMVAIILVDANIFLI